MWIRRVKNEWSPSTRCVFDQKLLAGDGNRDSCFPSPCQVCFLQFRSYQLTSIINSRSIETNGTVWISLLMGPIFSLRLEVSTSIASENKQFLQCAQNGHPDVLLMTNTYWDSSRELSDVVQGISSNHFPCLNNSRLVIGAMSSLSFDQHGIHTSDLKALDTVPSFSGVPIECPIQSNTTVDLKK